MVLLRGFRWCDLRVGFSRFVLVKLGLGITSSLGRGEARRRSRVVFTSTNSGLTARFLVFASTFP